MATEKKIVRLEGASALAKELGVTREYLWRVRTGRWTSKRLAAKLRERGISVRRCASARAK